MFRSLSFVSVKFVCVRNVLENLGGFMSGEAFGDGPFVGMIFAREVSVAD